jgi:hypothetical protein
VMENDRVERGSKRRPPFLGSLRNPGRYKYIYIYLLAIGLDRLRHRFPFHGCETMTRHRSPLHSFSCLIALPLIMLPEIRVLKGLPHQR